MPSDQTVELSPFERRFTFLFPAGSHVNAFPYTPRYTLIAPDILEWNWSVFDHQSRVTVGRGKVPEHAVDAAMLTVETRERDEALRAARSKTATASAQTTGAE